MISWILKMSDHIKCLAYSCCLNYTTLYVVENGKYSPRHFTKKNLKRYRITIKNFLVKFLCTGMEFSSICDPFLNVFFFWRCQKFKLIKSYIFIGHGFHNIPNFVLDYFFSWWRFVPYKFGFSNWIEKLKGFLL